MDLSTIKSGNDYLMKMYQENNPEPPAVENQPASVDADVIDPAIEPTNGNATGSGEAATPDNEPVVVSPDANQADSDLIVDWDPDVVAPVEPATPSFDFKTLGKALGVEAIDSEQKLVEHYKTVVSKNKELEKISAEFKSAPEPLREALEIAAKGGDYLEYLGISTVDYDSLDDRTLVEESLINLGLFNDGTGNVDEDALAEYVDGLGTKVLQVEAAKLRLQQKQLQSAQKAAVVQKAEQKRIEAISELKSALDKLESVGPFKLSEGHKKAMFDDMSNGQIMKVLFYTNDGKFDYNKLARIYFKEKHEARINQLLKDAIRKDTTKAIANDLKNVDLTSPGRIANPTAPTAVDPLDAYMARLMKTGK